MRRVFLAVWAIAVSISVLTMVVNVGLVEVFREEGDARFIQRYLTPVYLGVIDDYEAGRLTHDQAEQRLGAPMRTARPPGDVYQAQPDTLGWSPSPEGDLFWVLREPPEASLRLGPFAPHPDRHGPLRLVLTGVALALGGLALWGFLSPLDRSQQALVRASRRLAGGDLKARVPPETQAVAPHVGEAFNAMADQVDRLVEQRQAALRAVSHELRTPLARLRLQVHLLGAIDEREAMQADLQELDELVDELLAHARLQHDGQPVCEAFLATPILRQVARQTVPTAAIEAPEELVLHADAKLFRRAVRNLLSNAHRHASHHVVVHLSPEGVLEVDDDGPGFDDILLRDGPRAFGIGPEGENGVGLSIVQEIVEPQGGTLHLSNRAPGARVRTTWPTNA